MHVAQSSDDTVARVRKSRYKRNRAPILSDVRQFMTEQLLTYRGVVYPSQCDHMGHMNVAFYTAKFDEASWHVFHVMGLLPASTREDGWGTAAVEYKIQYIRELKAGDLVTVHSTVLELKAKSVRIRHSLQNDETGEIAATAELVAVCIDKQKRKSCPFPQDVVDRTLKLI